MGFPFKKSILLLLIVGVTLFIVIRLLISPSNFRWVEPSLVQENANFKIMTPFVLPKISLNEVFLLIIVSSAPAGVSLERRKAIRSTWGKYHAKLSPRRWAVVFMMGRASEVRQDDKLLQESKQHKDLLICDYKDSYDKILNKLLASFNWAAGLQKKRNFQYVLKTDDDVYVNIPRLYEWIDKIGNTQGNLYAGVLYAGEVNREKNHRHYVSEREVPYYYYPPFCKGSMMILSSSLLPKIIKLSRKIQRIVPDDAYIGLIMNELRVRAMRLQGMVQQSLMPYILKLTGLCVFKDVIGLGDSLTPGQIREMHRVVLSEHGILSWLKCILFMPCVIFISVIVFIVYIRYGKRKRY